MPLCFIFHQIPEYGFGRAIQRDQTLNGNVQFDDQVRQLPIKAFHLRNTENNILLTDTRFLLIENNSCYQARFEKP